MEQRVQPAAPKIAHSLNPPDPAENAATGTTTDALEQTSRSTTPNSETRTRKPAD